MPGNSSTGFVSGASGAGQKELLAFFFRRAMADVATATLVRVIAVYNDGGDEPAGLVDVQPLVMQIDGQFNTTSRPTVYGVPYGRVQGGTNAVILDPEVDDIGVCVFGDRDLSSAIASQGEAAPGSNRRNSLSDALYVCSVLGKSAPTQYVQFNASGITVVSPTQITLQAPTIAITGHLTVSESANVTGEVTGNGIELSQHVHTGVQSGSSNTGKPTG
ncbi:hypothetical protein [Rhodanobacter hydrolyticus]|uniref:Baseplate assembly protein n=1 Tax=Rhodanobacter hydrolyticus TaxID=2250595 RepID=A0ABW8J3M7_9GAMM